MAGIFAADMFCDDCADEIKNDIAEHIAGGGAHAMCEFVSGCSDAADIRELLDGLDERDYDSDDYPKGCMDGQETDSPQHCGCHSDCVNAIELDDSTTIGDLISDNLTEYGINYVREAVREGGIVAEYWRDIFHWITFDAPEDCVGCGAADINEDGFCFECAVCDDYEHLS